jgi:hypothetical protein
MNAISPRAAKLIRWVGAVIVAVTVSVLFWSYYTHDDNVNACMRGSERAALQAAGQYLLADRVEARGGMGDSISAKRYRAVGDGLLRTMPVEEGKRRTPDMAEVFLMEDDGKKTTIRLTAYARELQRRGCEDAYPPPIPFVK